jgi:hypothetical protein
VVGLLPSSTPLDAPRRTPLGEMQNQDAFSQGLQLQCQTFLSKGIFFIFFVKSDALLTSGLDRRGGKRLVLFIDNSES